MIRSLRFTCYRIHHIPFIPVFDISCLSDDPTQLDKVFDWTPMKRLATVEEVAGPIVFLCMDCSGYMTGQCLGVDGGLTAQGFQGPCVD